jgi:hypothetical protein
MSISRLLHPQPDDTEMALPRLLQHRYTYTASQTRILNSAACRVDFEPIIGFTLNPSAMYTED